MELQGLSNPASRAVLQVSSGSVANLASEQCCNDPACNCVGGKAVAQQQLASQSTQVQLSEQGRLLAAQLAKEGTAIEETAIAAKDTVQAVLESSKARAGLSELLNKQLSRAAQQAINAYQQQA